MNGKRNTVLISVLVILVVVFSIICLNSLIGDLNKSEIILAESDFNSPEPTITSTSKPYPRAKADPTSTPCPRPASSTMPTAKADPPPPPPSVPKPTKKPHPTPRPNKPIIMSNKATSPIITPSPTSIPVIPAGAKGTDSEITKPREYLINQNNNIDYNIRAIQSFNMAHLALIVVIIIILYLIFSGLFGLSSDIKRIKVQNSDLFRELTSRVERMEQESKRTISQTGDQFNQRIVHPKVERADKYHSLKRDTPVSPSPALNKPYQSAPFQTGMVEPIPELQQQLTEEEYIQQLVRLYNLAANNEQQAERSFFETYKPLRLGVANVKAKDVGQTYQFEPLNDGDYLAIDYSKYQPGMYLVVPRFKLNYQDNLHGPGGMGYVFQSDNYDARMRYYLINLIRPSIFQGGSSWVCVKKGRLRLEQGEPIS